MKKTTNKNRSITLSESTINKMANSILNKDILDRKDLFFLINTYFRLSTFQIGSKVGINPSHLSSILKGTRPLDPESVRLIKLVLFQDINKKTEVKIKK